MIVHAGPRIAYFPWVLLVLGNVAWQERKQRQKAEIERDAAKSALADRPDPNAVLRELLRLHDAGREVRAPFHAVLEELPRTIPLGRNRYQAWMAECTAAIEEHRPAFALEFRAAAGAARIRGGPPMIVIVKGDDGRDIWVNMDEVRHHDELIELAQRVLAKIIAAG